MSRPRKIKHYYPELTAKQNAEKNGVSINTINTYIRVNGIDQAAARSNAIIKQCHAYLKKHPNATWKEVGEKTRHAPRTIQKFRQNILSGELLPESNPIKAKKRQELKEEAFKKQWEALKSVSPEVLSTFLSESRIDKTKPVDNNKKELWSSILKEVPKLLALPKHDNQQTIKAFNAFLMDVSPEKPMLFIGSGGANGSYAALLYGIHCGIGKAITPLQFMSLSDKAIQSCKILLISKGGHNDDIVMAAKRALKINPDYTACLTFLDNAENRLLKLFREGNNRIFMFPHPEMHDGFTSVRGKIYRYALYLHAFMHHTDITLPMPLISFDPEKCFRYELNNDSRTPVGLEHIEHFIVLFGGFGEPVALDFESVMAESGVASVQVTDYRNFCHGRFIFPCNYTENSKEPRYISNVAVIMLISPREQSVAKQIRKIAIPTKTPVITIESEIDNPATTIDLLIKSSVLIASICEDARRINPCSPQNYSAQDVNKQHPMGGVSVIEEYEKRGGLSFNDPVDYDTRESIKQTIQKEQENTKRLEEQPSFLPRPTIDDLYRDESYDASKYLCYAFRTTDTCHKDIHIPLGNMCNDFPFEMHGVKFKNSEAAYICGLFSENYPACIEIQEMLINAKSGFDAKKYIRLPNEEAYGREDWYDFNVEWMLYCVWQKVQGNEDFRQLLLSIPEGATIIEDSSLHAKDEDDKAAFWGCRNAERLAFHDNVKKLAEARHVRKSDVKKEVLQYMNACCNFGVFVGKNVMGKILMIIKDCLHNGANPPIDYEVIEYVNIYLLGKRIDEKQNAIKYHHLPEDFYDE